MKSRRELRAEMRRRRRSIPHSERTRLTQSLTRLLAASLRVRRAKRVACYLAHDGEMSLAPIVALLRSHGRRVFLPALHGKALWFLPYDRDTPLALNRFGIPEPDVSPRTRCRARDLDLVLMPLVAFDSDGRRLGMGGGYYDRTFAYLRGRAVWKRPLLIGIAYEFQRLRSLPEQPWDVPLDGVVTEKHLYRFGRI